MRAICLCLGLLPPAWAQYYVISTVAGNGQLQFRDAGNPAVNARLVSPRYVAADASGNVFFSDSYYNQVFQISAGGIITLVAGNGQQGFSGDGGLATAAQLDTPAGLAVDSAGNLYMADAANARVRKVSPGGVITTFAGNGRTGVAGDGGSATSAAVGSPTGLAVDSAGNLYVSQSGGHVIRQVRADGNITTFAGTGVAGYSNDGGQATAAMLFAPLGIKVDAAGNVFVADSQNYRIRKITPQGVISTFAGNGQARFAGDGLQATLASISGALDVAIDSSNNVYFSDSSSGRVRVVSASGIMSTLAGGGNSYADGPASQAILPGPTGVAVDRGAVVVALNTARQVRRVSQQTITTIAGALPSGSVGDNVLAISAPLLEPFGVAADASGNVYVSDQIDNRVRKISPAGIITTAAGNGLFGLTGDGGLAINAQVGTPRGLAFDASGSLYVVSGAGAVVRRIAANGTISTVAGSGTAGYAGDGGPATAGQLLVPIGVAADAAGNVFIADTNNNRIRRVDAVTKNISTVAGTGVAGYSGDNGLAVAAQVFQPRHVALDASGNLYVADTGNSRVRRVSTGSITTVAGNGGNTFSGDGGPATLAQISANGIASDSAGNLYISGATRIRRVDAATGVIATIAGTGAAAFSGDGGLATNAALDTPEGILVDGSGNIYFVDRRNFRVRKLTPVQIVAEGVANGGTLRAGPVAPGEIVSIFGFGVGPATAAGLQLDAAGRVATQLAGTQVLFDGVAAPLIYVSSGQVNAIVPYAVAGKSSTQLQVVFQGKPTNTITLPVAASSPGLFAITNVDGSVNSASNPAAPGSTLVLFGTGEGQTDPPGVDGNVATAVYPKPVLPVSVQIAGRTAVVAYAGAAPLFVSGVLQINVQIPQGVSGNVALQVKIGDATTPAGLTISVRAQ